MNSPRPGSHPADDALLALVGEEDSARPELLAHVAGCATCSKRLDELRKTRALLESIAADTRQPRRDLARRALASLRLRNAAIGNINEVFAALRSLLAGFADLLGGGRPSEPPGSNERRNES